jgi:membrane fusion protein (multidrug efflux system)
MYAATPPPCVEHITELALRTLFNLVAAASIAALGMTQAGCGNDAQSASPDEEQAEDLSAVPVEVGLSRFGDIAALFSGTATLEAEEEADVVAKATGVVQRLLVEEGDFVQAGDVLAELDSERSSLELMQMEANLKRLENDLARTQELYDKNLVSADAYEEVKFQFESQKAAVDLARLSISYSTIRTPIGGYVSERMIKVGSMVQEHEPVFRVTDFDPLLAVLYVPEREMTKLSPGQSSKVTVGAFAEWVFPAKIKRISPVVDPQTGTFKVTLEVFDPSGDLKPGMLSLVSITYDIHESVVLVPKEAVIMEDDEASVFVIRDSVAYKTTVETGYSDEASIEIVSGIPSEAAVVTTGQATLKDSSRVLVVD